MIPTLMIPEDTGYPLIDRWLGAAKLYYLYEEDWIGMMP